MQTDPRKEDADIVVIGGGLAGVTAANVLSRQWRVILVDPRPTCAPVFKAEKIEPDQAELLRTLGLLQHLLPRLTRIYEIQSYYRDRPVGIVSTEQYAAPYNVMVDTLREGLCEKVQFRLARAVQIRNSSNQQCVKLDCGEQLICRLVVLACGLKGELLRDLQLERICVQQHQSIAAGFDIMPVDGKQFSFDALTYLLTSPRTGIDYVSLFPIDQQTRRANLFAFPVEDSDWLRKFVLNPQQELRRLMPGLRRVIGHYSVAPHVQTSTISLYRTQGLPPAGVVLIGDSAQNVCPSTGLGLNKVLTDIDVLCSECVPEWFRTPGTGREKMAAFAAHPRKVEADKKALQLARYRANACTNERLKWRIHRSRLSLRMELRASRLWARQGLELASRITKVILPNRPKQSSAD
jgi:2-polyprenyl-6-methoxyphenol hydroxylase-like FAD-dependent oxidoreductase